MNQSHTLIRHAGMVAAIGLLTIASPLLAAEPQKTNPDQSAQPAANTDGNGMGPGMMGGYGMEPGMMGGYDMGPGMMGGYGMGPGMMGGYGRWGEGRLNLSDAQRAQINKIADETRKLHWGLMGQMMDQQSRLRDLLSAPKKDDAAIGRAYRTLADLQQQMYRTGVDAHKRMEAVLTKEQREKLRKHW